MKEIRANILEGKYEDILAAVQSPVITLTELIKNAADSCLNKDDPITVNICTEHKTIEILDTGIGICEEEIQHLGEAGYSSKMVGNNISSPIDNPFSGSKGLGLLTAFFISDELEIKTYSLEDKKAYSIIWTKGNQKYNYEEIDEKIIGTSILLKNVSDEKLKMILLPEEKVKLFMTSLRFFTNDPKLPKIRLIIDGKEENYYPTETLESFYTSNRKDNKGFVAKASFEYIDNKLILSYQDNVTGFYTFDAKVIDFKNRKSVDEFVTNIKAPEKGVVPIRKISESELFDDYYSSVKVPRFSGVFYTWRNQKDDKLEQWPVGVRIYVNNYSLYRYLDKDNDWLNLSEVSQNVKATNYKMKNTYGYVDIEFYNENQENLKISKERNDFVDSLAQRKFIKIMREIIVAVFTRIDMIVKNPPIQSLEIRDNLITARVGEKIKLSGYVICNNIGLDDVQLRYDKSEIVIDENWNASTTKVGTYEVELIFAEKVHIIKLQFKEKIPEFALTKDSIEVYKGNSVNLREFIARKSCKDLLEERIEIFPKNKITIIKNDLFDKDNIVGHHIVLYKYGDFQRTLFVNVKEIEKQPGGGAKSPRIDVLFPKLDQLRDKSFKIPELVDAISSYYVEAPTLCMAAIRILVEASCKSFFQYLKNEEIDISFEGLVNKVINLQKCSDKENDYKNYVLSHDSDFVDSFKMISSNYNVALARDVKTNINHHMKELDLNKFVHNPSIIATDTTVYKTMQIFSPLLNYIFDVLLIEEGK
ncbi:MAG: ATP-binding protein [Lachnospira sp.]|nr:ATP-binding protein [Lachnospira sp.]